jgi:hypothetical protein
MELTPRDPIVDLIETVALNRLAANVAHRLDGFKIAKTAGLGTMDQSFDYPRANCESAPHLRCGAPRVPGLRRVLRAGSRTCAGRALATRGQR